MFDGFFNLQINSPPKIGFHGKKVKPKLAGSLMTVPDLELSVEGLNLFLWLIKKILH